MNNNGFTLIELLIVVAIIAILSTITLVALNPKEIFKKVYDVNKKTEVNNILFALDNHFIDTFEFPWGPAEIEFHAEVTDPDVGICDDTGTGDTGCLGQGTLVESGKLNPSFMQRKAFRLSSSFEEKYFVIAEEGTLPSICFVPSSSSIRGEYYNNSADLRVLDFGGDNELDGPTTELCSQIYPEGSPPSWGSLAESCFDCIPLKPLSTE